MNEQTPIEVAIDERNRREHRNAVESARALIDEIVRLKNQKDDIDRQILEHQKRLSEMEAPAVLSVAYVLG